MVLSSTDIKKCADSLGFDRCGIAKSEFLEDEFWRFCNSINANYHAGMRFLERDTKGRFDPKTLLPGCKSVVVATYNYLTSRRQKSDRYLIARYAHIEDYHVIVKNLLESLAQHIVSICPEAKYRTTVDSSSITEKNWAVRSGIGRFGKNGLIHNEHGSFFVIGTLLLDQIIDEYDKPLYGSDCGNCSLCVENCPTNALETPYIVDANRCVSYHNTEDKSPDFNKLGEEKYIFGCDICQEICPKNKKIISNLLNESKTSLFLPLENAVYENLTEEDFKRYFANTSIIRRKYKNFMGVIEAKRRK